MGNGFWRVAGVPSGRLAHQRRPSSVRTGWRRGNGFGQAIGGGLTVETRNRAGPSGNGIDSGEACRTHAGPDKMKMGAAVILNAIRNPSRICRPRPLGPSIACVHSVLK